jgi:Ca2+-binding EF-hand superfamily protein
VDEEELTAIFKQFDIDGNDQLDADEMRELCKALAALIPGGIDDILQIMDFYQITYDDQFDRAEVRMFLECHVVDNLSTAPS